MSKKIQHFKRIYIIYKQNILDKLGNARYYSALHCGSGYWQIALQEQDKPKAYRVLGNHYEFDKMSFGLKSASATYQRMMNTVLCNVLGEPSFVYLDDVLVFGRALKQHYEQLQRLVENGSGEGSTMRNFIVCTVHLI